jgi:hypothetical protein
MRYRDILFSLMQSYDQLFSNINCQFFAIFCKNIFYDEKSSKPNGFVLILNACDDGNLTQEAINFEDITTQTAIPMILYKLKRRKPYLWKFLKVLYKQAFFDGTPTILDINSSTLFTVFITVPYQQTIFAKPYHLLHPA